MIPNQICANIKKSETDNLSSQIESILRIINDINISIDTLYNISGKLAGYEPIPEIAKEKIDLSSISILNAMVLIRTEFNKINDDLHFQTLKIKNALYDDKEKTDERQ